MLLVFFPFCSSSEYCFWHYVKVVKVGILSLFQVFSISPLSVLVVVGLLYKAFTELSYVPSIYTLISVFIMKDYYVLSIYLFCFYWDDIWFWCFIVKMFYHVYQFVSIWTVLASLRWVSLERGECSSYWSIGFSLLFISWGFLHSSASNILACSFHWFWYQGNAGLVEGVWNNFLLFNVLE